MHKKQLFTLVLLLIAGCVFSQSIMPFYADQFIFKSKTGKADIYFNLPTDNVQDGVLTNAGGGKLEFRPAPKSTVPTGPTTSTPSPGFNPGTTDLAEWIRAAFFKAEAPTATIAGGYTYELMGSGPDLSFNLSWSASRKATTTPFTSIKVGGIEQSNINQVAAGAAISGTQTVTAPRNATTVFQTIVTTQDGQQATASTTVAGSAKRYFGWVSSTTPTDAQIIAAGGEFASNNTKSNYTQAKPSSPQYFLYAFPTSFGLLTKCDLNGFPGLAAMGNNGVPITRTLVNASGYSQQYYIYVTAQAQNDQLKMDAD